MKPGAIKIYENFIQDFTLKQTLEDLNSYNWTPVWEDKRYAGEHWLICPLIENYVKSNNFEKFNICKIL